MKKKSFDFDKALKERRVRGLRNVASLLVGYADRLEAEQCTSTDDYLDFILEVENKNYNKEKFAKIVDLTFSV